MPYRKKKFVKRRAGYYKKFRGFARGVGTVAKLARDVYYLKSLVNAESKAIVVSASGTNVTNAGTLVLINGMAQGTSLTTRIGQSVKSTSCYIQYYLLINTLGTGTVGRVIIFLDRQPNAAAPAVTDLLNSASVVAPTKVSNNKRFKILMDRRHTLSANGTEVARAMRYIKLRHHVRYNSSNNGDITDITTNSLYLLFISNEGTNYPTITYQIKYRFIDN